MEHTHQSIQDQRAAEVTESHPERRDLVVAKPIPKAGTDHLIHNVSVGVPAFADIEEQPLVPGDGAVT